MEKVTLPLDLFDKILLLLFSVDDGGRQCKETTAMYEELKDKYKREVCNTGSPKWDYVVNPVRKGNKTL